MRQTIADNRALATGWHLATFAVIAACLCVQIGLTLSGHAVLSTNTALRSPACR